MLILSLRLLTITFFTTLSFLTSCCFTALANIPTVLIAWAGLPKLPFEGIFFVIFLFFCVYRYILFVLCCLCVILFLFYGCNNKNLYSYSKSIIYIIYVHMIHISIYCLIENRFNCNYNLSIKIIQHYLRNIYDVSLTIVVLALNHSFY